MSGRSFVMMIVSSICTSVLFASPLNRHSTENEKPCMFNGELCNDIADRLIANMSLICPLYLEPELSSSIPFKVDDECENGSVVIIQIIETIDKLRKERGINAINLCNFPTATISPSTDDNPMCWSTESAYQSIVHYYVALEHIIDTLQSSYSHKDKSFFKLYKDLVRYVQNMRCSYGILTQKQKMGCSFGGYWYENNDTAKKDVLATLESQPTLPSPLENDTVVQSHECMVLKNLETKAKEIRDHLQRHDQPC
uniref:Uncharacterized protein n=1 Tax=Strigamia maritima TaxID=126957 RepID=T1IIQ9_STRMM